MSNLSVDLRQEDSPDISEPLQPSLDQSSVAFSSLDTPQDRAISASSPLPGQALEKRLQKTTADSLLQPLVSESIAPKLALEAQEPLTPSLSNPVSVRPPDSLAAEPVEIEPDSFPSLQTALEVQAEEEPQRSPLVQPILESSIDDSPEKSISLQPIAEKQPFISPSKPSISPEVASSSTTQPDIELQTVEPTPRSTSIPEQIQAVEPDLEESQPLVEPRSELSHFAVQEAVIQSDSNLESKNDQTENNADSRESFQTA